MNDHRWSLIDLNQCRAGFINYCTQSNPSSKGPQHDKKILCAIDNTDHAKAAIIQAAELSAKTGAALTLCTVNVLMGRLRGPPIYPHDDAVIKKILAGGVAVARQRGAKLLLKQNLRDARYQLRLSILPSKMGSTILSQAPETSAGCRAWHSVP